jgi:hypothetical protein
VLTITRKLNTSDLAEVETWYRRQFTTRACATQAATIALPSSLATPPEIMSEVCGAGYW